jgi:uncharacterized protein YheU (UPF0270 family)
MDNRQKSMLYLYPTGNDLEDVVAMAGTDWGRYWCALMKAQVKKMSKRARRGGQVVRLNRHFMLNSQAQSIHLFNEKLKAIYP